MEPAKKNDFPPNTPLPKETKHPLRCSIQGDTHLINELKSIVSSAGIPDPLKAFIATELDGFKSNAASIHAHLVDHPQGGFDLHLSVRPVHLGARAPAPAKAAG